MGVEQCDCTKCWWVGWIGAEIHVIPVNDVLEHDENDGCGCLPVTTWEEKGFMITHNAWDGRE